MTYPRRLTERMMSLACLPHFGQAVVGLFGVLLVSGEFTSVTWLWTEI